MLGTILYIYIYIYIYIKSGTKKKQFTCKNLCVLHSSLSNFLLANRESGRGMGRRQPQKLGAGGGASLAGLLHVLECTM